VARKHTLKLRELRRIRSRFVFLLGGMGVLTLIILVYLGIRVFVDAKTKITPLDFASLCFFAFACLVLTVAQLGFLRQLTVGAGRRIEEMTYTDDLTGLGNRRHIARFLSDEFREAQLSKNPLSLVYMDLDKFKQINDEHGHNAGDLVLRAVSHALKDSIRDTDFAGRAGGDEFVVILPDTDSQCASVVAHRIADRLSNASIKLKSAQIEGLTASMGITSYPANANTREGLIEDADRSMYAAKNSGHGQTVVSITRPAGPEPRKQASHVTTLASHISEIVDRKKDREDVAEKLNE
jgi:diguanylate cyclase (GGDEF)-like protein